MTPPDENAIGTPLPAIRIGLKQVKGISKADLQSILAARVEGPFTSLPDFCRRTTVPRDVVENLILAGAFDRLGPSRRYLLWELDEALRSRVSAEEDGVQLAFPPGEDCKLQIEPDPEPPTPNLEPRLQNPKSKIQNPPTPPPPHPHTPIQFPEPTLFELAQWEVDTLGLTVRTHPTALFRERLEEYNPTPASELPGCRDGQRVRVAGVVLCRMRPPTKSGVVVVFITLEDETGVADTVIFPRVYDEYGKAAFASDLLVVEGRVQKMGKRDLTLIAEKVFNPLEGVIEDRIDGKTGLARRELPLPRAPFASPAAARDYNPAENDPFHEQFTDPLADAPAIGEQPASQ